MQAIVHERYGEPTEALRLAAVDRPTAGPGEALVRVRAASVHPDVWHVVTGHPYFLRLMGAGVRRPRVRVPGSDLAGVVEAVGPGVADFEPGDRVFGEVISGHQWKSGGAYAEYASVRTSALARIPDGISFEQAAATPSSGFLAVQAVDEEGGVTAGKTVLVNGAGGGVGSFAVQLARARGATVTSVDAGPKLDTLRAIGANEVIDYTIEDFTRHENRYDVIIDIPGNRSLAEIRRALTADGRYVFIGHDRFGGVGSRLFGSAILRFLRMAATGPFVSQRMTGTQTKVEDKLALLAQHLADGSLRPVVDRSFPLAEVPAALEYLATGEPIGKVVIALE